MKPLNYRIRFEKEEEGGYTVIVPDLAGCVTFSETVKEAISIAKEAIEGYIETLIDLGKKCQQITIFWSTQFLLKPMPRLPVLTPQKLARALEKAGFELIQVRGPLLLL